MLDHIKDRILMQTDAGFTVFSHYLPGIDLTTKKTFKSPFYEDGNPSCSVFRGRQGTWLFKDHGDGGTDFGDCFWFVAKLKGLDVRTEFTQVLYAIVEDLGLSIPVQNNLMSSRSSPTKEKKLSQVEFEELCRKTEVKVTDNYFVPQADKPTVPVKPYLYKTKPFSAKELSYWRKYGITEDVLNKYKVLSLLSYSSFRSSDNEKFTIYSKEQEPMYLYSFGLSVKVYRPFSKVRFLQGGIKLEDFVFGVDVLSQTGEYLFLTGGEKDVMTLGAHGFNAICFNSETSGVSEDVLQLLSFRFRNIVICYDVDQTGVTASKKLVEDLSCLGVLRIELPLPGTKEAKDVSDYFAQGHTRTDFLNLLSTSLSF